MDIRKVLHPTDFSACAREAFAHAAFLADKHEAELHVVHAVTWLAGDAPYSPLRQTPEASALQQDLEDIVRDQMARAVAGYEGKLVTKQLSASTSPSPRILEYAEREDIDLVVMGARGRRGLDRMLTGSVAAEVVREAACPVLTICEDSKDAAQRTVRSILVPIDFSEHSTLALAHAVELATEYGARITLLHVVDYRPLSSVYGFASMAVPEAMPDIEAGVQNEIQRMAEKLDAWDVKVSTTVAHGPVTACIIDAASEEDADMIVQASHGRTGLKRFLMGSVAESVMREAACPVFTVKSFGKSIVSSAFGLIDDSSVSEA